MAAKYKIWQIVLVVAAIALVVALIVSGHLITGVALLILLLAMGGGALLYKGAGPPKQ